MDWIQFITGTLTGFLRGLAMHLAVEGLALKIKATPKERTRRHDY